MSDYFADILQTWCESQATTVAQQQVCTMSIHCLSVTNFTQSDITNSIPDWSLCLQDFVNDRIGDIDKLVAKVFEKCLR